MVLREDRQAADRQAAAFVAAESIALMADYLAVDQESHGEYEVGVRSAERFARMEAALLYLFAQYDACASAVLRVSSSLGVEPTVADQAADWSFARLEQLCRREIPPTLDTGLPFTMPDGATLSVQALEQDTVARLYGELGLVSIEFTGWLGGTMETDRWNRLFVDWIACSTLSLLILPRRMPGRQDTNLAAYFTWVHYCGFVCRHSATERSCMSYPVHPVVI